MSKETCSRSSWRGEVMLTLFSIPKAFGGHIGADPAQRGAELAALGHGVQVMLVGDEAGVAASAGSSASSHVPGVALSEHGTPRIDDAFARVDALAEHPLRCFVNADVVLLDDFLPAVTAVEAPFDRFLIVGATARPRRVEDDLVLDGAEPCRARSARAATRAARAARPRSTTSSSPPGLFDPLPPFVVGRARFDNWLVWQARAARAGRGCDAAPSSPSTSATTTRTSRAGSRRRTSAARRERNEELAGGSGRIYTIFDASHRLQPDGAVRRYLGSTLRLRERARKAAWKLAQRGR